MGLLACVIAGISVTCYVSAVRWNLPPFLVALAERIGPPWAEIERLCRVISPLALPPRVAPECRYLFGALGDRLASPYDTTALWRHWGRPRLVWYAGGHDSSDSDPYTNTDADADRDTDTNANTDPDSCGTQ